MLRVATISACFSVCAGLLLATTAMADVFKFVDEKGQVQYTDRPQKLPAERLNIISQRTDLVELEQREDAESKAMAEREKARQKNQKAGDEQKKTAATNESSKAEACAKAREDYRVRTTNWRLFEEQPDGQRRYLDGPEVDAARDQAKKAMDELCN